MTIRVLIADDHPVFREGLRFTLERAPDIIVAGEAGTGAAALALAVECDPDVIIMDLTMPVMDGLTAIARLRTEGSRAAVLVLTMTDDDAGVFAAIRAGAQGYLVKGAGPEQVLSALRGVAAGHAVFGPHLARRMLSFFAEPPLEARDRFPELSAREHEVLTLLAAGRSNNEIAESLVISPITARNHVSNILAKLQLTNRRDAMIRFHQRDRGEA